MTPEERQRVDELFERLSSLETSPRDRDAEGAIASGLRRAPNATYALVQTVLVQDEALRAAEARIAELEQQNGAARPGAFDAGAPRSFLDSMRDSFFGSSAPRGSVPSVRPGASAPMWNGAQEPPRAASGGGSFLGTAAAAAAGVIGGSLLINSLRGMMGPSGNGQSMFDSAGSGSASPWSGNSGNSSGGELSRDAGLGDVGNSSSRQGLFDQAGDRQNGGSSAYDSGAFDTAGIDDASLDGDDLGGFDVGDSEFL